MTPARRRRIITDRCILALAAMLVLALLALLTSCASTRHDEASTTVRRTMRFTAPLPTVTADGAWTIAPQQVTGEVLEQAQTTTDGHRSAAPDWQQLAPAAQALAGVATGGWSSLAQGGGALLLATLTGWAAKKHGEAGELGKQVAFHRDDAAEAYAKLDAQNQTTSAA